ncbi:protein of unknown function [Cupriavidus taiwanensis]|nr:protein of unknown function [Cupriavidus taiwanensis]SOZ43328.1 protein of unknown function [Cupriavidus taiwanensis]
MAASARQVAMNFRENGIGVLRYRWPARRRVTAAAHDSGMATALFPSRRVAGIVRPDYPFRADGGPPGGCHQSRRTSCGIA